MSVIAAIWGFLMKCDWLCLGEVRLAASLALFAMAGIIIWRFRYYMATEEWLRAFGSPPQAPWRVALWFLIAIVLCFVGALIAPNPL